MIEHLPEKQRFEYRENENIAYLSYTLVNGIWTAKHTIVPEALGGRGIATQLAQAALNWANTQNYHIEAECSFVSRYLQKHPLG